MCDALSQSDVSLVKWNQKEANLVSDEQIIATTKMVRI